ncbi:MAG: hypothetical protein K8I82_12700, partial [Anaerolineae bacterium]|nr:hypothetical protein [Anaerolineae bacterium]
MTTIIEREITVDPRDYVLSVSFMKVGKRYFFDFMPYPQLLVGDRVIVESNSLGEQMGEIKGFVPRQEISEEVHKVLRPATPADLLSQQQWQDKEIEVLIECREKAAHLGGYDEAKFVSAEYNYNGTMLIIMFTAEEDVRVNTQRLRSSLQKQFGTRIEMRQIGAREVAKIQTGFGACGIPRCCSTFLTEFSSISINMAKAQGISLNPSEITGMCGRLRCCLMYEYEQYVEARKNLPKIRKRVRTPHGEGKVIEVHPLQDAVTVMVEDKRILVTREELIPLDEYEALQAAAGSPCSKNESGGCDCGAKRPKSTPEEVIEMAEAEIEMTMMQQDEESVEESDTPDQPARPAKRRRRFHNKRHSKNKNQKKDS